MSRRKRHKEKKSRKKLLSGIIVVIFILLCLATYSYLKSFYQNSPNPSPFDQLSNKVAIVDHLGFREETKNETFKISSTKMLETSGFDVTYYPGEDINIDFYRNLISRNYGMIIFRVHSAIILGLGNNESLGFFTSQLENESWYEPTSRYYNDFVNSRIVRGLFPEDPTTYYFAIAPGFIKKYGNFQNTIIIIMGCDGLKYNVMAEAFIKTRAKVCIGWNGLVGASHTDHATTRLLQQLTQGNTVKEAVNKAMNEVGPDQEYESVLKYYPEESGSCTIQFILGISGMETSGTNIVLAKEETRLNWR